MLSWFAETRYKLSHLKKTMLSSKASSCCCKGSRVQVPTRPPHLPLFRDLFLAPLCTAQFTGIELELAFIDQRSISA